MAPTFTPALPAANRRNEQKSTGPRTARGKGQSRLNSLRIEARASLYLALLDAPPCQVGPTAAAHLTPLLAAHANFAELMDPCVQAEKGIPYARGLADLDDVARTPVRTRGENRSTSGLEKDNFSHDDQTLNVIENTEAALEDPTMSHKGKVVSLNPVSFLE